MEEKNNVAEANKNRTGWGMNIPALSFAEVIEITKDVYNRAGEQNSIDALSRITNNSSSSSTFIKKISALRNFGIFTFDKTNYELTALGKKIAVPESFDEQANAIIEAFLNNENLKKIWEAFKGRKLPQAEFLGNTIVTILQIPQDLKAGWVEYFTEAGKYAGLLEERDPGSFQVLIGYTPEKKEMGIDKKSEPIKVEETNYQDKEKRNFSSIDPLGIVNNSWGILSTKTISNDKKAIIAIPEDLTQKDIDSLKVLLNGIIVQLDGLKKNED